MDIKGTRTEANLMSAFAGETQARSKYEYFARTAQGEGFEQIAAIFRETAEEVALYQKKNIISVEMEASAFFAICQQKKAKAAAAFVISDELHRLKWEPHFGEKPIFQNLHALYHCAVKTLTGK